MAFSRRRSAGTVLGARAMLTVYRSGPREARQAGDIEAADRGETVRMLSWYRGTYGDWPRRFMGCWLDLEPGGPVIRPMLFLSFLWRRIPVQEKIISAGVRPFTSRLEAWNLGGSGRYARGGLLEQTGSVVVACRTGQGALEFAVHRADVPLFLHYVSRLADARPASR